MRRFLALACFVVLIPSLASAQSDKVKAAMAALQAAAGKPILIGSDLYFGVPSADLVNSVTKTHGGDATVFAKKGNQYVRVATTLKTEEGTSAVGTTMDPNGPAFAKINSGAAYYGDATIFGKTYDTGYEPIKDELGAVIGAYFVGYPK